MFNFEGSLVLHGGHDQTRARQAAQRRKSRRHHRLSLDSQRNRGFLLRVDGLWIPSSGTENSSVIAIPEAKVKRDGETARARVLEKYQDSDIPERKLNLWAYFAKTNAQEALRQKYRRMLFDSAVAIAFIEDAVRPYHGEISRAAFKNEPDYEVKPNEYHVRTDVLAYRAVLDYLVALETFVGCEQVLGKGERRKWTQDRYVNQNKIRRERAHEMLQPLAQDIFAEWVDEAYWNYSSRFQFWRGVYSSHNQFIRTRYGIANEDTSSLFVPLEAYENTPEFLGGVILGDLEIPKHGVLNADTTYPPPPLYAYHGIE